MLQPPSGTVTFLFTDIERSTQLWESAPDAMRSALERHDALGRTTIEANGGYIVKTTGDGVHAAFDRAGGDALAAAVAMQRAFADEPWPDGAAVRVRIGMHTGEASERDGDYFGRPVNRAARLMSAAHGGQIVMSAATAEILIAPAGIQLVDLGLHRLRGLAEPMRVFVVHADELPVIDRPLDTEDAVRGNLPILATEYVGRIDVLKNQAAQLQSRRLVTLTGTGGVGKTRTAIEAGWLSIDAFPDGVWFLELAPLTDAGAVAAAAALELSVYPQPGMSMLAAIVDTFRTRQSLLIMDNCEHVLAAAAELASAVVAGCRLVTVLATSREPLGVSGERVVPIASLDAAEAGELFRDRAAGRGRVARVQPGRAGCRRADLRLPRRHPTRDRVGSGAGAFTDTRRSRRASRRPVPFTPREWTRRVRAASDVAGHGGVVVSALERRRADAV